ncbi:FAD/NAD(P)-binding domain-containing protein [Ganoderma leucocontextum]|nr:FAD/NAD(P)-binding domain-containing protein [Ganoderma leucocontextum]
MLLSFAFVLTPRYSAIAILPTPNSVSDSNAFVYYQFTFEAKCDWSAFYSPGHEIQEHLQGVVDKYKLMRNIKLSHEVLEEFEDIADVPLTAFGAITRWKLSDIPGIADYKGELHHTADYQPSGRTWKSDLEKWKDKRVGVVGSGSTATQVVSALAPHVTSLANYVRGQTWLVSPFSLAMVQDLLGRPSAAIEDDLRLQPEEIERFKSDLEYFDRVRHTLENSMNRESTMQAEFQKMFRKLMEEKLAARPHIAAKLIPGFPVDFVSSPIKTFTATGIETEDGQRKDLDLVFCATSYDTSWQLPFKIVGCNGVDLNEKWKPFPTSYLSVCVDGFPNRFMSLGPNSVIGAGVLLPILEFAVAYAVQATVKMQRERLKSMEVKLRAVQDFDKYIETLFNRAKYFPQSVYSAKCRSWYKLGKEEGRIIGLWPGSNLHAIKALQYPRWEDYDYERTDPEENSLYWLGDGQTVWNEKNADTGDRVGI